MSLLMFSRLVNEPYTNVRRAVAALHLTPKRVGRTVSLSDAEAERLAVYFAEKSRMRNA